MAEIRPLRGWRYSEKLQTGIQELTSPLFDVVSEKQKEKLYKQEFSSIHLTYPDKNDASCQPGDTLAKWKKNGIIKQDLLPAIYVYFQYYSLPGTISEHCRKGFICNVKLAEWEENIILRHEKTIPSIVNDRLNIIEKTELNVSPSHGLYSDPDKELEQLMEEAILSPIYETEDYQGVRDVLAVIQDRKAIEKFIDVIRNRQITLIDGHHRYQASLSWRRQARQANPEHNGEEAYNFHMMYLTNVESDFLRIMPTHRLVNGIEEFSEETVMKNAEKYFSISAVDDAFSVNEVIYGKKWTFGLIFKNNAYKIRLLPELMDQFQSENPDFIKTMDISILHHFILDKILGIPENEHISTDKIFYDRSFSDTYARILKDEAQLAIIVNNLSFQDIQKVCNTEFTLPQKTTSFYPKVISGFVYSSLKENEFHIPFNIGL